MTKIISSTALNMVSDACHKGFGACFGRKWIQGVFPSSWAQLHISVMEFFPILVMIDLFGNLIKNAQILFETDNSQVVSYINKQSSDKAPIMALMRPLILLLIKHNIQLVARHIPGKENTLADAISRFSLKPEMIVKYNLEEQPTELPRRLLPQAFEDKLGLTLRTQ